jgi:hypothetical protein
MTAESKELALCMEESHFTWGETTLISAMRLTWQDRIYSRYSTAPLRSGPSRIRLDQYSRRLVYMLRPWGFYLGRSPIVYQSSGPIDSGKVRRFPARSTQPVSIQMPDITVSAASRVRAGASSFPAFQLSSFPSHTCLAQAHSATQAR